MILSDTSRWIHHFRYFDPVLNMWLSEQQVVMHPMVFGELACGHLSNRAATLIRLEEIIPVRAVEHAEALYLLQIEELFGKGLGWVDIHLLASARVYGHQLYTLDKRLHEAAQKLGIAAQAASTGSGTQLM